MQIEKYTTEQVNSTTYKFYSLGPKGEIELRIGFTPINEDLYNLAFGVWDSVSEGIDDIVETKNNDMDIILGTVAQTTLNFLNDHPKSYIIATGSTAVRTRKYQMGINQNLAELIKDYIVGGFIAIKNSENNFVGNWPEWDGEWQEFEGGVNYNAFLLYLK